jgi:hypothetical protein
MTKKPERKSLKPVKKKSDAVSLVAISQKSEAFGTGIYMPVIDELLAQSAESPGFSIMHEILHIARDIEAYVNGGKIEAAQQQALGSRIQESQQNLGKWKDKKYGKTREDTLEFLVFLNTQLEAFGKSSRRQR